MAAARPVIAPELVQLRDLTIDHFRRHPVWVGAHAMDHDEPWYEDTDEETFRPWLGGCPVNPEGGTFLARARLVLANGTVMSGFATPAPGDTPEDEAALGTMQPHVFLPDGPAGFWHGAVPEQKGAHARLYIGLGRAPGEIFPIAFSIEEGLAEGVTAGTIDGFYYLPESGQPPIVRV